jgi:hypothetical protein
VSGGQVDEAVRVQRVAAARDVEAEFEPLRRRDGRHVGFHGAGLLELEAVLRGEVGGALAGPLRRGAGSSSKLRHVTETSSRCSKAASAVSKRRLADEAPRAGDVRPDLDVHDVPSS